MKFDLISDFHVEMNLSNEQVSRDYRLPWTPGKSPEFYAWDKDRKSDYLVIAGDTSNNDAKTAAVIREAARFYKHVFFTDGNHDHYSGYLTGRDVYANMDLYRKIAKNVPNVTYLDGSSYKVIDGCAFIGANGWYDFKCNPDMTRDHQHNMWRRGSNDPRCIRFPKNGYPDKLAKNQALDLELLVHDLNKNSDVGEIVVVTHTVPHHDGMLTDPTHPWYPYNGGYMNTEMRRVWAADSKKKIKTWVFGHTHFLYDFIAEDIRFVTNPRGYRGEKRKQGFTGIKQIDTEEPMNQSAFGEIEK